MRETLFMRFERWLRDARSYPLPVITDVNKKDFSKGPTRRLVVWRWLGFACNVVIPTTAVIHNDNDYFEWFEDWVAAYEREVGDGKAKDFKSWMYQQPMC